MICKGFIQPEKLPPTQRAAQFHGYRVHLQVMEWKMLDEELSLNPIEWGWNKTEHGLSPVTTDKEIAPPNILKVIRCHCKNTSRNQCGTNVCMCRKNGIRCMPACGDCNGLNCNNESVKLNNFIISKPPCMSPGKKCPF